MGRKPGTFHSGYTSGEGGALIAPLCGLEVDELAGYLIIGVHKDGRAVLAASGNLAPSIVPAVLAAVLGSIVEAGGIEELKEP